MDPIKPWSSGNDISDTDNDPADLGFKENYYGCSRAREYYLKAFWKTRDKELASKCAFMALHCDSNYGWYQEAAGIKKKPRIADVGHYSTLLKRKGFDNSYYRELIEECATYNSFVFPAGK
ncbi:hypothetical protein [Paraflavitalea speifideaquila]|uniref:hypothetical protein n=1 Tax=Paraflavitalea speifideaquila TaxID=3076558 RepID=UPI0028E38FDB|nr:hypothetical protein [Paraflavitalea speifideiaquila]